MWNMSVSWWELIVRAAVVYVFVVILLRLTGKRQIGQLAPFDLVLLLILANTIQNAINGGDNSVLGGFISATTIVTLNYVVGWIAYKNKTAETLIEGRPEVLIHNGKLYEAAMKKEKLARHELMAALRDAGCADIEDVHIAILENNGRISVTPRANR